VTILFFDTETFCETPIRHGHHAYAEKAEIMVAAWAIDDGPVTVEDLMDDDWRPMDPSYELRRAIAAADEIVIHNSSFDRTVVGRAWSELQVRIEVERVHDTMVRALAHGLPGSLDKLSSIFQLGDEAKDKAGKELIQLFCKPRPKNNKIRRATRATHPEKWAEFLRYAGSDIVAMRALYRKLPRWNYRGSERALWELDQRINDRGFRADLELAAAALRTVRVEQGRLKEQVQELTDGFVQKATQRDDLLFYLLQEYGVALPDMKKDTLERALEQDQIPEGVRELIKVRLAAATASTAKYKAITNAVSADGRLRGSLQFCGAKRTGRWAGRLFQPQNLPRPKRKAEAVEQVIAAAKADCLDLIDADVMGAMSDALRGMIIAAPGCNLYSSDLSNIESVVAAWLTGETWKLNAFAEIFAAKTAGRKDVADMYQRSYAKSFGIADPLTIKGDQRQIGKVQELGLGFEGGVGAFLGFAAVYRIDLPKMAEGVLAVATQEQVAAAAGIYQWRRKKRMTTYGLAERTFLACEIIKSGWRDGHPAFKAYWPALQDAAIRAVLNPGERVACGRLAFLRKGAWLRMILPSGRSVCYPMPKVEGDERSAKLSYMGENQFTRQWQRIHTYGGKLFENACQAVARDVMADAMVRAEEAGFDLLLTVHDDIIAEAPVERGLSIDSLSAILATRPAWMADCPLAASGFMADRYRKDE
jgi:DNA polymerase